MILETALLFYGFALILLILSAALKAHAFGIFAALILLITGVFVLQDGVQQADHTVKYSLNETHEATQAVYSDIETPSDTFTFGFIAGLITEMLAIYLLYENILNLKT